MVWTDKTLSEIEIPDNSEPIPIKRQISVSYLSLEYAIDPVDLLAQRMQIKWLNWLDVE